MAKAGYPVPGPEAAVQAQREVFQVAVVGKYPITAPELTHKRVAVFKRHTALGCLADVGNEVAAFDGIAAYQPGHGRGEGWLVIDKMAQRRSLPSPPSSKKAIAQPSVCSPVLPPRCAKPLKLKVTSVGVMQFIPKSWHMFFFSAEIGFGPDAGTYHPGGQQGQRAQRQHQEGFVEGGQERRAGGRLRQRVVVYR